MRSSATASASCGVAHVKSASASALAAGFGEPMSYEYMNNCSYVKQTAPADRRRLIDTSFLEKLRFVFANTQPRLPYLITNGALNDRG